MDQHATQGGISDDFKQNSRSAALGSKRRTDALDYMQSMLGQMRTMAQSERCDMLAYLIEMAYIEASDIIRGQRPARIEMPRRDAA